jgi:hypothetical protein
VWNNYRVGPVTGRYYGPLLASEDLADLFDAIADARYATSDQITDVPEFRLVFGGAIRMREAAAHHRTPLYWRDLK